jgi:hypothetical protein
VEKDGVAKKKNKIGKDLSEVADLSKARNDALASARGQIRTIAKVAIGFVVVMWLLAAGFASGLTTPIPYYVAIVLTVALGIAAFLVRRNLGKSEALGQLIAEGVDLSADERASRIAKLDPQVEKGEIGSIIAKAQLQMQDSPRDALTTLEKVNLEKAAKVMANQVRGMRAMIHLNLGEAKAARDLSDAIPLDKTPDLKSRANLAGIVAEAWARSGNPIEASDLLDKYNPEDKDFSDVKVQLLRARAFASAHHNKLDRMKKALKELEEVSPQLLAIFVGQKRVHPLLQQEAKKRLEKSGLMPKAKIQGARR